MYRRRRRRRRRRRLKPHPLGGPDAVGLVEQPLTYPQAPVRNSSKHSRKIGAHQCCISLSSTRINEGRPIQS